MSRATGPDGGGEGSGPGIAASAAWRHGRSCDVRVGTHRLTIDSAGREGPAAMEAVLAGLVACLGSTISEILDVMRVRFEDLSVVAQATEHVDAPRTFRGIEVTVSVACPDRAKAARAVALAEERYCPVTAILRRSGAELRVSAVVRALPSTHP